MIPLQSIGSLVGVVSSLFSQDATPAVSAPKGDSGRFADVLAQKVRDNRLGVSDLSGGGLRSSGLDPGELGSVFENRADGKRQGIYPQLQFEQLSKRTFSTLSTQLARAGIALEPPVRIEFGFQGEPRVGREHPQSDEIEALLRNDPELGNDLRQLSGLQSLIVAVQESISFSKAYEKDPTEAVQDFASLLARKQRKVELILDSQGLRPLDESP